MKFKPSDIISTAGILAVIYGFGVATLVIPDRDFSEDENRYLQQKPKFTLERLTEGKFTAEIADYFADQFPLRNLFVGAKAVSELAIGKQENNSVLAGKDGTIVAEDYFPDLDEARKNIAAIDRFAEALADDVTLTVAVAGRSQDILTEAMPALYPAEQQTERVYDYLNSNLKAPQVDLLTPLKAKADAGEYVYYRTDHHWTTLGAYYAYVELMSSWGLDAYPLEHFTREVASEEFYGTTWSKAGMKWVAPDTMEFFRYDGDESLTTTIVDNGTSFAGVYDRSYLEVKDKYSAFIGGNNGRVQITGEKKRETLVIIKDSFGHALAPFLAAHFDLEILDLRYYKTPTIDLVNELNAKRVLIMYNMDGVINSNSLAMLNLGVVGK